MCVCGCGLGASCGVPLSPRPSSLALSLSLSRSLLLLPFPWLLFSRALLTRQADPPYSAGGRRALLINRPPTGGDLTSSWKKGHI